MLPLIVVSRATHRGHEEAAPELMRARDAAIAQVAKLEERLSAQAASDAVILSHLQVSPSR